VVPDTTAALASFMLLVAPGIAFELLWEQKRPSQVDSTFREISRVVLASVCFSGLSLVLLSVVRIIKPKWMPDPGAWIRSSAAYVADHYRLVGRAVVVELVLALTFAAIASMWFSRRGSGKINPVSVWFQVFRTKAPAGKLPYVRVLTKQNSVYGGVVSDYRTELQLEDRELVLSPPLSFRKTPTDDVEDIPKAWERVVLTGSQIQVMWVSYIPEAKAVPRAADSKAQARSQEAPQMAAAGPTAVSQGSNEVEEAKDVVDQEEAKDVVDQRADPDTEH
jgi:hypothetical protein